MLGWKIFLSIFFGRELLAHDTALRAINRSCDTDVHCMYNLSHIKQLPWANFFILSTLLWEQSCKCTNCQVPLYFLQQTNKKFSKSPQWKSNMQGALDKEGEPLADRLLFIHYLERDTLEESQERIAVWRLNKTRWVSCHCRVSNVISICDGRAVSAKIIWRFSF